MARKFAAAILLGATVCAGAALAQQPAPQAAPKAPPLVDWAKIEIKTTDLGNKTYMLVGQGGNITVAVGSDGIIQIDGQFAPLSDKIRAAITQGEYAVGLTFESNAYAYVAGGQKDIELLYPEDGTFVSPESLTLIKNAPAGEAAKKVYDLLLAKETQIALLESAFRRPSRSDIDVAKYVKLPNLAAITVKPIDEAEAAAQRTAFLAEWTAALAAGK